MCVQFSTLVPVFLAVVRGFLGRRRARKVRQEAAKRAQEVKSLLHQVEKNSTTGMNDQNNMLKGDKSLPKGKDRDIFL